MLRSIAGKYGCMPSSVFRAEKRNLRFNIGCALHLQANVSAQTRGPKVRVVCGVLFGVSVLLCQSNVPFQSPVEFSTKHPTRSGRNFLCAVLPVDGIRTVTLRTP